MGVLADELELAIGEASSSASGVRGGAALFLFGVTEVDSESAFEDRVLPRVLRTAEDVEAERLCGRLSMVEPSSTLACFGFIFRGVPGLELEGVVCDVVSAAFVVFMALMGLARADFDRPDSAPLVLFSLASLNFRPVSSPCCSRSRLLSSVTAA